MAIVRVQARDLPLSQLHCHRSFRLKWVLPYGDGAGEAEEVFSSAFDVIATASTAAAAADPATEIGRAHV
jgi:hypothetical protein